MPSSKIENSLYLNSVDRSRMPLARNMTSNTVSLIGEPNKNLAQRYGL